MAVIDKQKIASALTNYIQSASCFLRPLQKTVFNDIAKDLNEGHSKGHIRFPTGGGKGTMIGGEIEALLKAEKAGKLALGEKKVLVLTPRTLLVDDLYKRFTDGTFSGIPPEMVGKRHSSMTDREKAEATKKPVLVTTYSTFNYLVRKGEIKADDYAIAMLDEVHRTRGPVVSQAIKEALPNSVVQGWTATDTYENGNHVGQELFGREKAIHKTTFEDAVKAKPPILCPMVNYVVRTHIKAGVANRKGEDYRPSDMKKLRHDARDKMAIEMLANHQDKYTGIKFSEQNSVFYCIGVKHAETMAEKLNTKFGEGYAVAVSGETPKDELQKIMKRYANPKDPLKAITNADLLIEGWDSPSTSLCFMLRPTKSPILAEQTGGRAMRLDPDNKKKVAYIMTFWDDNMPDMVTFGEVAGGFYMGLDENQRVREDTGNGEATEGKPLWMTRDSDLNGMDISFDYHEAAAFVERARQREDEQVTASPSPPPETGLMPESGWQPWTKFRESLMSEYGDKAMQVIKPAGELVQDIERQANARLNGGGETTGEVNVNINGLAIHVGRFKVTDANSGMRKVALAIDEEDIELVKEMIEERIDEKDRIQPEPPRAPTVHEIVPEAEWVKWPDLRAAFIAAYHTDRQRDLCRRQ